MTIDEKIQDFRQLEYDFEHCMCDTEDDKENLMKYQQEYEYYKQLADWLEELKNYRLHIFSGEQTKSMLKEERNKAIDDFVKEYKRKTPMENRLIDEIAEQLKESETE